MAPPSIQLTQTQSTQNLNGVGLTHGIWRGAISGSGPAAQTAILFPSASRHTEVRWLTGPGSLYITFTSSSNSPNIFTGDSLSGSNFQHYAECPSGSVRTFDFLHNGIYLSSASGSVGCEVYAEFTTLGKLSVMPVTGTGVTKSTL